MLDSFDRAAFQLPRRPCHSKIRTISAVFTLRAQVAYFNPKQYVSAGFTRFNCPFLTVMGKRSLAPLHLLTYEFFLMVPAEIALFISSKVRESSTLSNLLRVRTRKDI